MATLHNFRTKPGLYANGLSRDGFIHTDVDFSKAPCAAGDIIILFEIPKGSIVQAFGAQLIKQQPPTASDATLQLYKESGGVYTAVASGETAAIDVDNTEGMLFSANGSAKGGYLANERVFVGLTAGATTGALNIAKLRVWVKYAEVPLCELGITN